MSSLHLHFFIINKYGLLIYEKTFQGSAQLNSNDMIRFSSTLHTIYAISTQITPPGLQKSGLRMLNTPTFKLCCFQTPTGTKFVLISKPNAQDMNSLCRKAYQIYSDHVLKNPFYETDQQIKLEGFDQAIEKLFT